MTTDDYPVPVRDAYNVRVCRSCGCAWELDLMAEPNRKQEWCSEPGSGCRCHDESFADAYLNEQDRYDREAKERRNPVIVSGEEVLGYIGFSSFRDDVA